MDKIKNIPMYAYEHEFVVAREVDGDMWFYGAYDSVEKAENVANEIGGWVFSMVFELA